MSYARSERASSSRDTNSIDMAQPDRPGVLDVQTALAAVETKERRKRWRGRPSYAKDDVSRSFHLNHLTADRVSDRVNQPYRVAATNGLPGIFLRAQNASHGVRALSAAFGALSAVSSLPLPSLPFSADRSGCIAWTYGAGMRVSQDTPRSRARSLLCKQPENIGIDRLSTLVPELLRSIFAFAYEEDKPIAPLSRSLRPFYDAVKFDKIVARGGRRIRSLLGTFTARPAFGDAVREVSLVDRTSATQLGADDVLTLFGLLPNLRVVSIRVSNSTTWL